MTGDQRAPKPSHTPGPWRIERNARLYSFFFVGPMTAGGQWLIGETTSMNEIDEANANLIAAAPDLLAACQEFVRKVEAGEARSTRSYEQMKAAIRKATGEA